MEPDTKPEQETPGIFNRGMIGLIIGIIIVLVVLLAWGMMQTGQGTVVPLAECGQKTVAYVNNNLVAAGDTMQLVSITESKGLYELKTRYQSQDVTLYTSKDCTLLFTNIVNMTGTPASQPVAAATQAPVKTARPSVDMYVMSFCPYGTQAETVMSPVVKLLGTKADIRIRYITTVAGSTADSIDSLHGPSEAKEDLRQACINKYYPDKYWSYLDAFNQACYPSWQNSAVFDTCRNNTTASLAIDRTKIDSCALGSEGVALLKSDEAASNKDQATASPMLFINGVKYSGARNPEAFKQAICNSFETAPAECSTVLASGSAAASGGCG